jgi:hypothetical protein
MPAQKNLIEKAYKEAEARGLALWCHDQAGPFQTIPCFGTSWQPQGKPIRQPHEYIRNGTAKLMTLFHPASGQVRAKGVTSCPNSILHPWLQKELSAIVAALPVPTTVMDPAIIHEMWAEWYEGLSAPPPLPDDLTPLRMFCWFRIIWQDTNHPALCSGVSVRGLLCSIPRWAVLG